MSDDLFHGYGIRIKLKDPKDFNVIKETISRIGFASANTLYQSCHIFHKQGEYAIMHFKELFAFDGKEAVISPQDIARRNTITKLLEQWGLLEVGDDIGPQREPMSKIKIVSHKEKDK